MNNTRALNIKSRTDSTTLVPSSSEDIYGETCERGYETIVFFQVVAIVFILDGRCSKICGFAGLESLFNIYISKYFNIFKSWELVIVPYEFKLPSLASKSMFIEHPHLCALDPSALKFPLILPDDHRS